LRLEVFSLGVERGQVDAKFFNLRAQPVDLVIPPGEFMLERFRQPCGVAEIAGQSGDGDVALVYFGVERANAVFALLQCLFDRYFFRAKSDQIIAQPCAAGDALGELVAIVLEIHRQARGFSSKGGPGQILFGADFRR